MRTHALAEVFCFIFTVCEWSGKFISLMLVRLPAHSFTHSLTYSNVFQFVCHGCVCVSHSEKFHVSCAIADCSLIFENGDLVIVNRLCDVPTHSAIPSSSSTFFVSLFHCTIIIITPSTRFTLDAITD